MPPCRDEAISLQNGLLYPQKNSPGIGMIVHIMEAVLLAKPYYCSEISL